jgi:hypothetical protein
MQTLPFDAESLLNTSSNFHDELIMTGGKEIDTLGLDLNTGKVKKMIDIGRRIFFFFRLFIHFQMIISIKQH